MKAKTYRGARVELVRVKGMVLEGEKRQAIPYGVKFVCPKCGKKCHEKVVDGDRINYPGIGDKAEPEPLRLCCEREACGWYGEVPIRLNITAEIVGPMRDADDWVDDQTMAAEEGT